MGDLLPHPSPDLVDLRPGRRNNRLDDRPHQRGAYQPGGDCGLAGYQKDHPRAGASALLFIAVQCVGAIAGAALLMGVTPEDGRAKLGLTSINEHLEVEQAFAVETIITFVLVFTVFSSIDSNRKDLSGSAPLAIGLSVALCHLFAVSTYLPIYLLSILFTCLLTHLYLLSYLHTYLLIY